MLYTYITYNMKANKKIGIGPLSDAGISYLEHYIERNCPARWLWTESCIISEETLCKILKVHKHEIFFLTFFAETETIWSQGPVTRDF